MKWEQLARYSGFMSLALIILFAGCAPEQVHHGRTPANETSSTAEERKQDTLPEITESSTIEDYLEYAALNNPGLHAAFSKWKAEMESITQASSLPDPRLSFRYYVEEVETRVGPQRRAIGLSQMFPWFGKLKLRGSIAAETAGMARQQYEAAKRRLFVRVRVAYNEYYYLGRTIAIVKENRDVARALEEVVMSRYKTDAAGYADLIRLQVELGKLEDRLRSVRDMVGPRSAQLNAALNRPVDAQLPLPAELDNRELDLTEAEAIVLLNESNPDLAALRREAARARKALELAKKETYPDIMLGVDYIVTDDARMPDVDESGKDPVVAMLTINLPIQRRSYRAKVTESQARYESAQGVLQEKKNKLAADLKMALYGYRDAERKIDLYRDTLLPKVAQSLKATQQAFATGKASFLDVISTIRTLLDMNLSYERALTDRANSIAEIEMLVGDVSSRSGSSKRGGSQEVK